jgi:hypothetical protein
VNTDSSSKLYWRNTLSLSAASAPYSANIGVRIVLIRYSRSFGCRIFGRLVPGGPSGLNQSREFADPGGTSLNAKLKRAPLCAILESQFLRPFHGSIQQSKNSPVLIVIALKRVRSAMHQFIFARTVFGMFLPIFRQSSGQSARMGS